ncbi:MAG TPA: SDR family NAD(P)-dependent oxidoreductase [Gammaproteobacteria bacterium]|jgi:NAD(P)-dependent dehydrogenase (short-subunit alcohol dehydrogenase family)|nr:oxidoreductase [Chloroflexota bacterium]HJN96971.1 SDR family NAD(P)-dependent oxidoreductase [Gammaproteobacteria bacterium]|tara:strand:- start:386 stop:1153 length:768 start_codon:yes stop_codon:yes gene_type:complete
MGRLEEKVAIITGAAGGIGKAAAKRYVAEGCKVLLVDVDEAALEETAAELASNQVSYCVADVSSSEDTQNYIDTAVKLYGGVDILIANAGIEGQVSPVAEYPEELFNKVLAINVGGVFLGIKYIFPVLRERGGGSIVITSSIAGLKGSPGMMAYVTSKHAVIGAMRSAAVEGAEFNIRVNTVNPSPIETRMMRSLEEGFMPGAKEAAHEMMANNIPLGRYGTPEEIASLMLFLGSDESRFLTGSVYAADGGMSAS